jgi:hypothetical protein
MASSVKSRVVENKKGQQVTYEGVNWQCTDIEGGKLAIQVDSRQIEWELDRTAVYDCFAYSTRMSYGTEFAQSFVQGEDFWPERRLAMAYVVMQRDIDQRRDASGLPASTGTCHQAKGGYKQAVTNPRALQAIKETRQFVLHGSWIQKTKCSPAEFNARLEMHKLYEEVGKTQLAIQYGVHLQTGKAQIQNHTSIT